MQSQIVFSVGIIVICSFWAFYYIHFFYQNIGYSHVGTKASLGSRNKFGTIAELTVPLVRPFVVEPGMILYVWIPGVSIFDTFRSHPFFICGCENDSTGRATKVTLLVRRESRFAERLMHHDQRDFLTFIDGPYRGLKRLDVYRNILMVATGGGILGMISFIRRSVQLSPDYLGQKKRRIYVAWELEHPGSAPNLVI